MDIKTRTQKNIESIENAIMLYKIGELDEEKMLKSIKNSIDLTLHYLEVNKELSGQEFLQGLNVLIEAHENGEL